MRGSDNGLNSALKETGKQSLAQLGWFICIVVSGKSMPPQLRVRGSNVLSA